MIINNIDLTLLHIHLTTSGKQSDGIIFKSKLIPGIQGVNIGTDRWKDIIVRQNEVKIGRLTVDSNGIRILDQNDQFIVKVNNWLGMAFKTLLLHNQGIKK